MRSDPTHVEIVLASPDVESASADRPILQASEVASTGLALDDVDRHLVTLLLDDGRISNHDLAVQTGISHVTVANRIKRLVQRRALIFTTVFDWERAGFEWMAIAKLRVAGRSAHAVADEITTLSSCDASAVVFGDVDVIAYFLVKDRGELDTLIVEQLAAISGIRTMTIDLAIRTTVTPLGRQVFLARRPPPIRLPRPVIELDDLDVKILYQLVRDGRQSNRNIARELDVSEGTIRTRVQRMTSSGLIRITAMIEPLALGTAGVVANIGLNVGREHIESVYQHLAGMPQTIWVAVTVGSVEITAVLMARDQREMLTVILSEIRTLNGVLGSQTLQLIDILRLAPYMKRLPEPLDG